MEHEEYCAGYYTIDTMGCMFERGLINSILKNRCEKTGRRKLTTLYLQEECKVRDGSLVSTDIIKKLSSKLLNPVKMPRGEAEDGENNAAVDDSQGLTAAVEAEEIVVERATKKRPRKTATVTDATAAVAPKAAAKNAAKKGRGSKKAAVEDITSSSDSERDDDVIEAEL